MTLPVGAGRESRVARRGGDGHAEATTGKIVLTPQTEISTNPAQKVLRTLPMDEAQEEMIQRVSVHRMLAAFLVAH